MGEHSTNVCSRILNDLKVLACKVQMFLKGQRNIVSRIRYVVGRGIRRSAPGSTPPEPYCQEIFKHERDEFDLTGMHVLQLPSGQGAIVESTTSVSER